MFVQVVFFPGQGRRAAPPSAGVNKELVLEYQKVGIPGVAILHRKPMDRLPRRAFVPAAKNDRGRGGVNHVSVRTTPEGQIERVVEPAEIREGVVLAIVKHPADRPQPDRRRRGTGMIESHHQQGGEENARTFHGRTNLADSTRALARTSARATAFPPCRTLSSAASMKVKISTVSASLTGGTPVRKNFAIWRQRRS